MNDVLSTLPSAIGFYLIHRNILPKIRPNCIKDERKNDYDNISISFIHCFIVSLT